MQDRLSDFDDIHVPYAYYDVNYTIVVPETQVVAKDLRI
jgi:hypothetical protein